MAVVALRAQLLPLVESKARFLAVVARIDHEILDGTDTAEHYYVCMSSSKQCGRDLATNNK